MYSAVASTIFAARNADKTQKGDIGRGAVTLGQTAGVVQEVAKYDGLAAKGARSALSVFSELAKENKAFEYAGKATQFAVNNVNPLICVSGVIKTAMSDDKVGTGITEAAALSAMFAGEALTKRYYDEIINSDTCKKMLEKASENKYLKPIFEWLEKNNYNGKAGLIIKGLTFVAASMTAYSIGQKIGKNISDDVKKEFNIKTPPKKINQKA